MTAGTVSVLTWNLWWRFGPWEQRLPVIIDTIRRLDPDIVALQEVWFADGTSSAALIAQELGHHHVADHRLTLEGVGFGNAVLARWPISETLLVPLPAGDVEHDEQRCCVLGVVEAPSDPIQVWSTHLNWRHDESAVRQLQVRALCQAIAARRPRSYPPVLCGDFNAEPHSDEIRLLTGHAAVPEPGLVFRDAWSAADTAGDGRTWANRNPFAAAEHELDRRIDYVFSGWRRNDGRGVPVRCRVIGDAPVDGIWPSDHFGVLAELHC
jgi:endonuclease/exonuclease/phosphatase family metal-dependent hydrolase